MAGKEDEEVRIANKLGFIFQLSVGLAYGGIDIPS